MILIVDLSYKKNSLGFEEFVLPIASIVEKTGTSFKIKHFTELCEEDLRSSEKVILCGTALKDDEFLKHEEEFSWIKKIDKPVLGICAGMQLIGLVFGSELVKAKEIGMKEIKLKKPNKLFSTDLEVYELHKYSIKPSEDFKILAVSDLCVQAIKHRSREIYGVMFHPEVRQRQIVVNFVEKIF